ncbi:MAG: hypothetical protein BWY70_01729 [Bacteroidetes bacterium ADurb.Bin408]|nr:MAG: hypothetical protein BWY70_01729 [Bacteroidetes bacterium ADurb.Bin408]
MQADIKLQMHRIRLEIIITARPCVETGEFPFLKTCRYTEETAYTLVNAGTKPKIVLTYKRYIFVKCADIPEKSKNACRYFDRRQLVNIVYKVAIFVKLLTESVCQDC